MFDSDGSGNISLVELKQMMGPMLGNKMSDAEWKSMMLTIDVNNDGSITIDEFKTLMTNTMGNLADKESAPTGETPRKFVTMR